MPVEVVWLESFELRRYIVTDEHVVTRKESIEMVIPCGCPRGLPKSPTRFGQKGGTFRHADFLNL